MDGLAVDLHRLGHPRGGPGGVGPVLLTDRPSQARWLTAGGARRRWRPSCAREGGRADRRRAITWPRSGGRCATRAVLLLAAAYFSIVCGHYGVEFFLPTILERWYGFKLDTLTWLMPLPFVAMMAGQLVVGWSSDRTRRALVAHRRAHVRGRAGLAADPAVARDRSPLTLLLLRAGPGRHPQLPGAVLHAAQAVPAAAPPPPAASASSTPWATWAASSDRRCWARSTRPPDRSSAASCSWPARRWPGAPGGPARRLILAPPAAGSPDGRRGALRMSAPGVLGLGPACQLRCPRPPTPRSSP